MERSALREEGNDAFKAGRYDDAIEAYTKAIRMLKQTMDEQDGSGGSSGSGNGGSTSPEDGSSQGRDPQSRDLREELATLHSNRSAAFASLCRQYLDRPAALSERSAMFGLEPGHLAALALKDAQQAVAARPDWPKAHARLGTALFLSERYAEAEEAYLAGLNLEPTNTTLQEGLREVSQLLAGDEGQRQHTPAQAQGAGPASPTSPTRKRARVASATVDDWECSLCLKLLYEPVTTPCGHTFCRACFSRAMDHRSRCPCCRTVLHIGRDLPVTCTLANILTKCFPQEYAERAAEEAAASAAFAQNGPGTVLPALPLFVMSTLMPGEHMSLNIFEPRYRLLVRRAMEGNRRIGMAQLKPRGHELEEVAVESEIIECAVQPDGRYYIEVVGRRRALIQEVHEVDGYRVARAQVITDTMPAAGSEEAAALATLAQQVAERVDELVAHLRTWLSAGSGAAGWATRGARMRMETVLESAGPRPPADKPEALSFWAAMIGMLVIPDLGSGADRGRLLGMRSTRDRLQLLKGHLDRSPGSGSQCTLM